MTLSRKVFAGLADLYGSQIRASLMADALWARLHGDVKDDERVVFLVDVNNDIVGHVTAKNDKPGAVRDAVGSLLNRAKTDIRGVWSLSRLHDGNRVMYDVVNRLAKRL